MYIGITWQMPFGMAKLYLRRSQFRKREKIGLNRPLMYIHPFPPHSLPSFLYLPLFNSVAKMKLLLRTNSITHSSRESKTRLSLQQLTIIEAFHFEVKRNGK
jgi:hypothetical protein